MAKSPKERIAAGVTDAINKANRVRTTPKLARIARLPGNQQALNELVSVGRKARDRLLTMNRQSAEKFAQITKERTAEFKHYGQVEGDKPGMWSYMPGWDQDKAVRERNKVIDRDKKAHAKSTETERTQILQGMLAAAKDMDRAEPLHYSTVAILLRQTMGDEQRARYATILQGAGIVAIDNAILDCVSGTPDKALGAAIITVLEKSKTLRDGVTYSREDVADFLVGDEYWDAQEAIGLFNYFVEQSSVAVLELEGKSISTDRKTRAGLMKHELEKATCKLFNEAGDTVDAEGNILTPQNSAPTSDDFYERIRAESIARDKAVVHEKRRQAAEARKKSEDEVLRITKRTEAEENALYGGAS